MTEPDSQPTGLTVHTLFSKPEYLLRGGIVGACVSAFISWNSRKVSKIGILYRKWKLVKNFIVPKKGPKRLPLTNYFNPPLNRVLNNFLCYSGEPGIGKSHHFEHFSAMQSLDRPVFYIKFKNIGDGFNFDKDISDQIGFGGYVDEGASMITDILKAAQRINDINNKPHLFWLRYVVIQALFINAEITVFLNSHLDASLGMYSLCFLFAAHISTTNFLHPILIQSIRKTIPLIILDDVNKIQSFKRLSEITRFLKIMQENIGNVILVSSDEDTWTQLRKQPGLKDRLRLKQMKYNHIEVAKKIIPFIDSNFQEFMSAVSAHPIYKKQVVAGLVEYLIGLRQLTLRRFSSILRLNDQQQYEKLIQILENKDNASTNQIVVRVAEVLFENQMQTMVANLKAVKRELKEMRNNEFINQLNILQIKMRLPSDSPLGPLLQLYSIVREYRSEYIFNGRFMFTVFGMAVREYINDIAEYEAIGAELSRQKTEQSANTK